MLTVPAFVWRGGFLRRTLTIGVPTGLGLGALAWIDAGMLLAGAIVFVIMSVFYGIWMARRMARYWPGARQLSGDDRVTVAHTARRGERIGDVRLADGVIEYAGGIAAADETVRFIRWVIPVVLVVGVATAAWDAFYGTWGNAIASAIYLVLLFIELFWWHPRRNRLLANTERAANLAAQMQQPTS